MEFPELGTNCSQSDCNQLDFLPVKCDACGNKFCSQHWQYQAHSCPNSHVRNVQVPVCPLCDQPVPTARGVVPDIAVSAHIDRDCKSDPAVKKRIYTNRCSMKSCKQVLTLYKLFFSVPDAWITNSTTLRVGTLLHQKTLDYAKKAWRI